MAWKVQHREYINSIIIAVYCARWVVDLVGLLHHEMYNCLIIMFFCTTEINENTK